MNIIDFQNLILLMINCFRSLVLVINICITQIVCDNVFQHDVDMFDHD